MSSLAAPLLTAILVMVLVMSAAWATQRVVRNAGWIDVFWTFGTGVCCLGLALWPSPNANHERQVLVAILAAAWSFRLGTYIAARVASSGREDQRYKNLRADWGRAFDGRIAALALIQAPATTLLAWSVYAATHATDAALGWRDAVGAAFLLLSIGGEAIADEQMRRFKARPAHTDLNETGLWGWSRHPNYFFEWLGWLAYPAIGFSPLIAASWATWIAPVLMYAILRYGTGVPALEAQMVKSRGQRFRDYQNRVSVFFPLPPRSR